MSRDNELLLATPGIQMPVGTTTVKSTSGRVWTLTVVPAAADATAEIHNTTDGSGASKYTVKGAANGPANSVQFPVGLFMDAAISVVVAGAGGIAFISFT